MRSHRSYSPVRLCSPPATSAEGPDYTCPIGSCGAKAGHHATPLSKNTSVWQDARHNQAVAIRDFLKTGMPRNLKANAQDLTVILAA